MSWFSFFTCVLLFPKLVIAQDSTYFFPYKQNLARLNKISFIVPNLASHPLLTKYVLEEEAKKGDPIAQMN